MPAFHTFQDTLAAGWITGSMALTDTLAPLAGIVYPANWINTMQIRLLCNSAYYISSVPDMAQAVPGIPEIYVPLPVVHLEQQLWVRGNGGGETLYYIIEGKTSVGNA